MIRSARRPDLSFRPALFVVPLLLVASAALRAQPDTLEHTLLWRIDGNGLAKSSYLYGTFHTSDARMFNFRDSVLPALLACDIAAFELQMDSMSTETLRRLYAPDSVIDLRDYLTDEEFELLDQRIREGTGLPGEAHRYTDPAFLLVVLDQPEELTFDESATEESPEENPFRRGATWQLPKETFLDAWLFRTARLEGKEVIGLETIDEQIAVVDTLPLQEQVRMLVETITVDGDNRISLSNRMMEVYQAEDLNRMLAFFDEEPMSPGVLYKLLDERNHTMAGRLEKLMRRGSVFAAVGAGHLPGEDGLIRLLRRMGFTVTPVISGRTGVTAAYKRPSRELPWYSLVDSAKGFSVETPMPAVDFPVHMLLLDMAPYLREEIDFSGTRRRFITDITTGLSYLIIEKRIPLSSMLSENPFTEAQTELYGADNEEARLLSLLGSRPGRVMRAKEIVVDGVQGKEFTGIDTDGDLTRMRVFRRGGELYSFIVSGGTSVIKSKDDSRFLKSIRFRNAREPEWKDYNLESLGITAYLPDAPDIDSTRGWSLAGSATRKTVTATAIDPLTGIYYIVERTMLSPGATAVDDSLLLRESVESGFLVDSIANESMQMLPPTKGVRRGSKHEIEFASGATLRREVWLSGGTVWSLAVARPREASDQEHEKKFFSESRPTPPDELPDPVDYGLGDFSVRLRSPLTDSTGYSYYSGSQTYEAGEWIGNRAHLARHTIYSPYYEAESEEEFFAMLDRESIGLSDTIVSVRTIAAGGLNWHERTVAVNRDDAPAGIYLERSALHGAHLYTLRWFSLDPNDDPSSAEAFFNTFRLLEPAPRGDIFSRKIDLLFADLASSDPTTRSRANDALWTYRFKQEDLPKIYAALEKEYPAPENEYEQSTHGRLIGAFREVHDERTVGALRDLYRGLPFGDHARSTVLDVLAAIRTDESLEAFKELLLKEPPGEGYGYTIFSSFYGNLSGIEKLYPRILELAEDPDLRAPLFDLTNSALDSGIVSVGDLRSQLERLRITATATVTAYRAAPEFTGSEYSPGMWEAETAIALLGKLPPSKEVDNLLKRTLRDTNLNVKRASAVALLRHGEEVREKWLEEVAADPLERLYLYRNLELAGKLDRFPKESLSQILFAQSLVAEYLMLNEEYPPEEIEYIADRAVEWNGARQRGYLLKFRYRWYGEDEEWGPWYAAFCAQPGDPDRVSADATGVRVTWNPLEQDADPDVDRLFEELMAE